MANYQQSTVTGESWVRSNRVVIENPLGGVPCIQFAEEQVINLGTETIKKHVSDVVANLLDPAESFAVVDPTTGEPTGTTATYGEVYVLLHSLYLDLATKRDASA